MERYMSIGGRAFNGGVNFVSDDFSAKLIMQSDGTYKVSVEKRIKTSGIKKIVREIPLIKGLFSMFTSGRIILIIVLVSIISDAVKIETQLGGGAFHWPLLIVSILGSTFIIIYIIKTTLYKIKETWRFHGAEHKTIYAYEHNMELTLENVKSCPRIARRCGTNMVVFMLFFYITMSFFIEFDSVKLIASYVLGYELFDLENGDKLPVLKLFFKLGNWCQQHIFTMEPTDAQMLASIETMKKLIEAR